jgi:hypothetical protein
MVSDTNFDELEDIDMNSETLYEVWAVGYDCKDRPTEFDYLLYATSDPDDAITFADAVTSTLVRSQEGDALIKADHFSIEVETTAVIDDEPMNLGTIYRRTLYYTSITADVAVTADTYELLGDGSIKIKKQLLENFKDKEAINILFMDTPEKAIIPFKIIGDCFEDCFVCDIVF